jgi:hypothetical protein
VIDEQGFAKYSNLYPGNQAESKMQEIIESLIRMRPGLAKDQTVIIDAGIATKENISYLKANHPILWSIEAKAISVQRM